MEWVKRHTNILCVFKNKMKALITFLNNVALRTIYNLLVTIR